MEFWKNFGILEKNSMYGKPMRFSHSPIKKIVKFQVFPFTYGKTMEFEVFSFTRNEFEVFSTFID